MVCRMRGQKSRALPSLQRARLSTLGARSTVQRRGHVPNREAHALPRPTARAKAARIARLAGPPRTQNPSTVGRAYHSSSDDTYAVRQCAPHLVVMASGKIAQQVVVPGWRQLFASRQDLGSGALMHGSPVA
jgi:hypothetical protein